MELNTRRTTLLPQRERDATPRIVAALNTEGITVTRWGWRFIPEVDEWYLLVHTTVIGARGPAVAMQLQKDALAKAQIETDIACRVLLVKG